MSKSTLARVGVLAVLIVVLVNIAIGRVSNGFDLRDSLIPVDQIHLGGPPRDGIPAIDRPRFVEAGAADFLQPDDRVLGLRIGNQARAYPVSILNWHEVVNDRFGKLPVSVTYCPLCGTGVAFSGRDGNATRTFGVSGLLYNSDVLLYDRETKSLWSQLMMQAVSGPRRGERLEALPLTHTTWTKWSAEHPGTRVLSTDTGYRRDYERDPYAGYASERETYFPVNATSRRYHPKERVLGIEIAGIAKAYPFTELARSGEKAIVDHIGDQPLKLTFDAESETARAFDADGRQLPATSSFWFAWYAFHPDGEVYTAPREQ